MKQTIWLLRLLLAAAALLFLVRMAFLLVRTALEARTYAAYAYYDPTVFVVVGLLLLPALLLGLQYGRRLARKAGRQP